MKIKLLFISLISVLFIIGCEKESNELILQGDIKDNSNFKFESPEYIEDNYTLNLNEDADVYFKNNVVELSGFVPVSSYEIMINNRALFDLKKMFDEEKYNDLVIRRGYLNEAQSKSQKVNDHKTGYDFDVYVKGNEWTDFEGNKDADSLILNSYKYGFVLRYEAKDDYQPWHYRYIGKVHSNIMHNKGLMLNEYVDSLNKMDSNAVYKIKDSNTYLYKVSKEEVVIPKGFNYSISSINDKYYVIDFNTDRNVTIKKVDNQNVVEKSLNDLNILYDLILVNKDNMVPMIPNQNLVSLTKYLTDDNNPKYLLEEKVLKKLKIMLEEANDLDRHTTYLTSAYRTYDEQESLYVGGEEGFVQKPNYSEHQTGLAFDLSNSFKPNTGFTETAQGLWVKDNAHRYGFILRYPQNKVSVTGIKNEQWHFRYVGEIHATYMKENNLVLEEYLDEFELEKFYEINFNNEKYLLYKTSTNDNKIKVFKDVDSIYYISDNEYIVMLKI